MSNIEEKQKEISNNLFPVVGVGASAGGLDSFKRLLHSIPANSGMAFILVQHLHPDHKSSLGEILQRDTDIPISVITDKIKVEPDHIYVIPSNKLVVANDGLLELSDRPKNEKNMPIDIFFTSLAEVHQSHAIGVVLSGYGTDGTIGLKSIRDAGGLTIAEDPSSAAYDVMPASAINEDVVDFILPAEDIPKKLLSLRDTLGTFTGEEHAAKTVSDEETFKQILSLLRVRKAVDFTYYKQTTIRRRILRRMLLIKLLTLQEYLDHLKNNKTEQDMLFQDLLIPVTEFFRDPAVFDSLSIEVLPHITDKKSIANPLRIWIAGCSTGQEAYSYGICLQEYLGDRLADIKLQIFATDLSSKAITYARAGVYSKKELEGVSESRLQTFFYRTDGHYQIIKSIRDMFIFSPHNFLKDPPFANLDMVSCRNVLIYLEPFLQKKAFNTFHYSLREKGILILGKSETVGTNAELFSGLRKNDKIYQKKAYLMSPTVLSVQRIKDLEVFKPMDKPIITKDNFQKTVDEILLSEYTPAGVVVNEQLEIVQFRGSTGKFLEPSPGRASLNILKMAKEGLSFEIRNAVHKLKPGIDKVSKKGIVLRKANMVADIEVLPLPDMIEPHYLILFREAVVTLDPTSGTPPDGGAQFDLNDRILALEKELAQAREDMRSITEDQEASNEELQSANEELLSGSEELQSLNEELESSKEELQSTNEELITVNQELFDRTELYNKARLYAEGIVSTIHEPLLVLDTDLKIVTANNAFFKSFGASEEDVYGVHLYSLQDGIWATDLIKRNIARLKKNEAMVLDWEDALILPQRGKRILSLNAQPVFRGTGELLYLLAIEDITIKKEAEEKSIRFSQDLEHQVTERTNSLKEMNIELTHSNKNLEQFASIASHDLQEPLRKIQTFGKLLHVRHPNELSPDAKELIDKIIYSSERMGVLIKDVLSFYRMSHPDTAFRETNLDHLMTNVLQDFDLLIAEKKAEVKIENLPTLEAIPLQMNQLFYNLMSNSLKFCRAEQIPKIEVSSRRLSSDDVKDYADLNEATTYFEIQFRDNGIGFEQEYATQIFLIFQRLNTLAGYEGTGIGLALCEKIVNNHHGLIRAQGKENEGATFYVILPEKQPVQQIV